MFGTKLAVVLYNGDHEAREYAERILQVHSLNWKNVMVVAVPFSNSSASGDYDDEAIEAAITAARTALARYSLPSKKLFIICAHEWDVAPAGEIAGALTEDGVDLLFYYPDGRLALPNSDAPMTNEEAKRVYRQVWGFDVRLANLLARKQILPHELLVMPEASLWAIGGLGEKSIPLILQARERILASQSS